MSDTSRITKVIVGTGLLLGFLAAFFPDLTSLDGHQILGTALGAVAVYHGWAHRTWIASVASRLVKTPLGRGQLLWWLDAALGAAFLMIVGTGLLISTWLALPVDSLTLWTNLHVVGSVTTLGLVLLKVAAHWRWFIQVARPRIAAPVMATRSTPVVRQTGPSRREFLGLMGALGAAAVAASASALGGRYFGLGIAEAQTDTTAVAVNTATTEAMTTTTSPSATTDATTATTATSTATATATTEPTPTVATTCSVRCGRGCSYPGHCGRYTDSNGNGLCDLGECL